MKEAPSDLVSARIPDRRVELIVDLIDLQVARPLCFGVYGLFVALIISLMALR